MNGINFLLRNSVFLATFLAGAANAQSQPFVEVSLTNIKAVLAEKLGVPTEQIPLMVQVPPAVASTVCKVGPEELKPQANNGVPSCPANASSEELSQAVASELAKKQK